MPESKAAMERIHERLKRLYGGNAEATFARISRRIEQFKSQTPSGLRSDWNERDVVLIVYGDQVQHRGERPLETLRKFLVSQRLYDLVRTVHILPFFPYSSDDGFSVVDYYAVDSSLGSWENVRELGASFELMFDLVLNHTSSRSHWFQEYLAGHPPCDRYFIEEDPTTDLSAVVRPRSSPLLTAFETSQGQKHVWTTFGDDQVDLNFANPDVLIEMLEIFLHYVQQGAGIIRLDAIAYLWKQAGTNCIHRPQTHEVVRLFRDVIDAVAPDVLLLTETNVPHGENISYFGHEDEAHLVYQFSLPPLLLDAMLTGDAGPMTKWLSELQPTKAGTGFLNFTASHDGVGIRPLEGLVSRERINHLVDAVKVRGGFVSTQTRADGTESPYELNVSYFSALGEPDGRDSDLHIRRFLTAQGLMLSLRGIPAIYFHSLFGTTNDDLAVKQSGQPRCINRHKFQLEELLSLLGNAGSVPATVFDAYCRLLSVRIQQPAFHPDASQDVWRLDVSSLVAFVRTSLDETQKILVLANMSDQSQDVDIRSLPDWRFDRDLLSERRCESAQGILVGPHELQWWNAI